MSKKYIAESFIKVNILTLLSLFILNIIIRDAGDPFLKTIFIITMLAGCNLGTMLGLLELYHNEKKEINREKMGIDKNE